MYLKMLSIGVAMLALWSCSGNNDANQQVVPVTQEQPVQAAPVDSTMAQPQAQAAPADAAAATAQGLPEAITAFIKQHFPMPPSLVLSPITIMAAWNMTSI